MANPPTAPALNEDFSDMLEALAQAQVEFVVVGAHAMAAHGYARATGDIDILVRPASENAARVVAALQTFGAPVEAHGITQADFERLIRNKRATGREKDLLDATLLEKPVD
jgi:hypothetical protein